MNILSADIGKEGDFTAISISTMMLKKIDAPGVARAVKKEFPVYNLKEYEERTKKQAEIMWGCRHLERLALGTSYPDVVRRITELMTSPELRNDTQLIVDTTGVGNAVCDYLRDEGLAPVGILIQGGSAVSQTEHGYSVPKRDLVTALQLYVQTNRMIVSRNLPLSMVFVKEMMDFRLKKNKDTGAEQMGAWRSGENDDLVLSLAMTAWYTSKVVGPVLALGPKRSSYEVTGPTDDYDSVDNNY